MSAIGELGQVDNLGMGRSPNHKMEDSPDSNSRGATPVELRLRQDLGLGTRQGASAGLEATLLGYEYSYPS